MTAFQQQMDFLYVVPASILNRHLFASLPVPHSLNLLPTSFWKVFLIQCSVIHNSFTTVRPDLLLNTFFLLPVYQVPSTCASRDL